MDIFFVMVKKQSNYDKLESIGNMIVGYDKNEKISILDGEGKELYKEDKKTEISLFGLPVIHQGKEYIVLYNDGEVLKKSKEKIISAYTVDSDYAVINFEKTSSIYNLVNEKHIEGIKIGGNNQLMDHSSKKGYLLYNRKTHEINALDLEGKIIFTTTLELDDLYYDNSKNIIGVKNQTTYLFNKDGETVTSNSYYRNYKNYVVKNKEMIYGPHKFVNDGKEIEVNGIQLDPMASFTKSKIFPVYVRDEGYQYYGFDGKEAIKESYKSAEAFDENNISLVDEASVIFFTGGDQLRITSLIGGTPLYDTLQKRSNEGCYFVGTSAGASVMSDVMIVGGEEEESPKKSTLNMSAGLGLIKNTLIDQHFAQRGRIGRLLSGVCQNPEVLGVGIDEDTAIVINDDELTVIGSGAVYFVDGRNIEYTNVSEKKQDEVFSIFNIKLHVLTAGKKMNLSTRVPFEEERNKNEDK